MEAIILAGGKGTRMKSIIPKVLVKVEGVPLIKRVFNSINNKYINRTIIVLGQNSLEVQNVLNGNITYAYQNEPLGTLDAYIQALPYVSHNKVMVVPADIPFLSKTMMEEIIEYYMQNNIRNLLVGMKVLNPYGYGRIIQENKLIQIKEQVNLTEDENMINTINTGIYIFNVEDIYPYLSNVTKDDKSNEFYLTDFINYLSSHSLINTIIFPETFRLKGANNQQALKNLINESLNENTFKKNY